MSAPVPVEDDLRVEPYTVAETNPPDQGSDLGEQYYWVDGVS